MVTLPDFLVWQLYPASAGVMASANTIAISVFIPALNRPDPEAAMNDPIRAFERHDTQ